MSRNKIIGATIGVSLVVVIVIMIVVITWGAEPLSREEFTNHMDRVIESENSSKCNLLENEMQRDLCFLNYDYDVYVNKAIISENISHCSNLDPEFERSCRDDFFLHKSNSLNDTTYCENISSSYIKNRCLD